MTPLPGNLFPPKKPDAGSAILRGYALCAVPRSGSNWLCQVLTSTGVLGRPLEYFNVDGRRTFTDPLYPAKPADQIEWILTKARTRNDIYGLKLFAYQLQAIARSTKWTRQLPNLHFVYFSRKDVLGQAISWAKALQTRQYRSTQGLAQPVRYDRALIRETIAAILEEQRLWSAYFARNGLSPVELTYEELVADPQSTIDKVARLFGVTAYVEAQSTEIDLEIQRDSVTEDWRKKFIADDGDLDRI